MSSRHLLDPELAPLLDLFGDLDLTAETLPAMRAQFREPEPEHPALASGQVRRSVRFVPGPPGAPEVRVMVYHPVAPADGVQTRVRPGLFHIHGGGYVVGEAAMSDFANAGRAAELDCVVVSVDYRLAPETIFPGAVEDCYAALVWMYGQGTDKLGTDKLGVDPQRIAILGESAGGGLAAGVALLARDRAVVTPILQMLIYPMLDDRTGSTIKPSPFAGEYVWTDASNRFGWSSLLGHIPGSADTPVHAAAARAVSVAGLPPAFIAVGALDLFVDEDIAYGRRLIAAGVPTELHVYPGAIHAFDMMERASVSRQFARDCSLALRRAFGLPAEVKDLPGDSGTA